PGLEEHADHLAPEVGRRDALPELDLAAIGHRLVLFVALLERRAIKVMQVRHLAWREERPFLAIAHALHEQVWNPVRRIDVMGAAALVAGVLAELEEVLDIVVPGLEVHAARTAALAGAVDGEV